MLLGVVALAVGIAWLATAATVQLAATGQPAPIASTPSQTESASANYPACDPGQLELVARVGDASGPRESFDGEELPLLWYEIVSKATDPCTFNVGTSVTFFTITSGEETIWSSRQCDRTADTDLVALLEPGVSKRAQGAEWRRVRSSQSDGCGAGAPTVVAEGASYHLRVEVNGVLSQNKQQFLLY